MMQYDDQMLIPHPNQYKDKNKIKWLGLQKISA